MRKTFDSITADLDIYAQYEMGENRELTVIYTNSEVAYWQPLFEKQFKHPKPGEKHYATLRGFVIAQIHQQLKKQQAG